MTLQPDVGLAGGEGLTAASPFPMMTTLSSRERHEHHLVLVYPSHVMWLLPDSMVLFQVFPHAADRTTLRITPVSPRRR